MRRGLRFYVGVIPYIRPQSLLPKPFNGNKGSFFFTWVYVLSIVNLLYIDGSTSSENIFLLEFLKYYQLIQIH